MENQIKQLIRLFSNKENTPINLMESWDSVDITVSIILENIPNTGDFLTSNPQLSSSASFLRLNVLSSLN